MSNGTVFRFDALENGLDYLVSAANHLAGQPSARDLKYGILHLAAGIEVLLKARLQREHWTLILTDMDGASPVKYASGDFQSISADKALRRLRDIARIPISDDDFARVGAIIDKRNRLQHHGLVDSTQAVSSVAARALDFLLTYVDRDLLEGATAESRQLISAHVGAVQEKLADIKAFVKVRLDSISEQLAAASVILQCPICQQDTFALGDEPRCLFCLRRGHPQELAETYVETFLHLSHYLAVKEGGEWPVYQCPTCEEDTLVRGATARRTTASSESSATRWACFGCGDTWPAGELDFCARCGRPKRAGAGEMVVCHQCFDEVSRRD
jgi:RNase P subunit RPR2